MTADKKQTSKSSGPKPYIFDHEVGVDVLELHDYHGQCHMFLNFVDQGTNFQIVWYLREGWGQPSSSECLKAFQQAWTSWAGWPDKVVTDKGLHNCGVFAKTLGTMETDVRTIGLESPEQLGRTERHGGMWKATAKRVIQSFKLVGSEDMTFMDLKNNGIMNESTRKGTIRLQR